MNTNDLAVLTADIVAAHVSNNTVAIGDMQNLIRQVHSALAGVQEGAAATPQSKSPAVSVRASVKPDFIVCMECGKKQKTLRRHLMRAHGMTPEQYRNDYGLPDTYRLVAPNYSESRRTLAKTFGLGRKSKELTEPGTAKPVERRSSKSRMKAEPPTSDEAR